MLYHSMLEGEICCFAVEALQRLAHAYLLARLEASRNEHLLATRSMPERTDAQFVGEAAFWDI
jgi:hypothetical protein